MLRSLVFGCLAVRLAAELMRSRELLPLTCPRAARVLGAVRVLAVIFSVVVIVVSVVAFRARLGVRVFTLAVARVLAVGILAIGLAVVVVVCPGARAADDDQSAGREENRNNARDGRLTRASIGKSQSKSKPPPPRRRHRGEGLVRWIHLR